MGPEGLLMALLRPKRMVRFDTRMLTSVNRQERETLTQSGLSGFRLRVDEWNRSVTFQESWCLCKTSADLRTVSVAELFRPASAQGVDGL